MCHFSVSSKYFIQIRHYDKCLFWIMSHWGHIRVGLGDNGFLIWKTEIRSYIAKTALVMFVILKVLVFNMFNIERCTQLWCSQIIIVMIMIIIKSEHSACSSQNFRKSMFESTFIGRFTLVDDIITYGRCVNWLTSIDELSIC